MSICILKPFEGHMAILQLMPYSTTALEGVRFSDSMPIYTYQFAQSYVLLV